MLHPIQLCLIKYNTLYILLLEVDGARIRFLVAVDPRTARRGLSAIPSLRTPFSTVAVVDGALRRDPPVLKDSGALMLEDASLVFTRLLLVVLYPARDS